MYWAARISRKATAPMEKVTTAATGQSPRRARGSAPVDGVVDYTPPGWAKRLVGAGSQGRPHVAKLQLANLPTPIHRWDLPGVPDDCQIYIKRDDMTGSTLSGNKVRKLEFLMADALQKGCKHIITGGGIQSNHCRATAVAAARLGLRTHLFLRGDVKDVDTLGCFGNLLLDRLCEADIYLVPRFSPYETHLKPRMERLAQTIQEKTGESSYQICIGGSDTVGVWGYLSAFDELLQQGVLEDFDDIVFACGSGGTAEGLSIGAYLTQSKLKVHGVAVCDDATYFHDHINKTFDHFGIKDVRAEDIVDIVEGHKGKGYGISQQHELDFICDVARKTGIMLDPVYTGKAVAGLVHELNNNRHRFHGNRILFVHTGGVFGMFDGTLNRTLLQKDSENSRLKLWLDVNSPPP